MPDKGRERWYVERLKLKLSDFPDGDIIQDESPDIVVLSNGRRVGIEVTAFHLPPDPGQRPYQERQRLKQRVVDQAFELHTKAGGPALYARVHFGNVDALRKSTVGHLASALADAVLRAPVPQSMGEGWMLVPYTLLPASIVSIRIAATVNESDRLWTAGNVGWVAPVQPAHIEAVIAAKRAMFAKARTKCDEVWLAIVNDAFIDAAQVELSQSAEAHVYSHPFARLLWLEPNGPNVRILKTG